MSSTIRARAMQSVAVLICLAGASLPAGAQTVRDLSVEQTQALQGAPVAASSLSILTLLDRADATYATGEAVRLAVKANEDAYVSVFNIGASGRVTQLFPNAAQTDNRIRANETIEIPSLASGAQIKVTGPVGAELVKVIATSKPVKIIPDAQFQTGAGIFRGVEGGVPALQRDLAVVANNVPRDVKVAVVNQIIKTVDARPAATPAPTASMAPAAGVVTNSAPTAAPAAPAGNAIAKPADAVAAPAAPAAVNAAPAVEQAFPLVLSLGKASYKVGEAMTIVAIPSEACFLTVFSTDQAGRTRILMPSANIKDNRMAAGQAQIVSGSGSPQTAYPLTVGTETVTAICAREAKPFGIEIKGPDAVLSVEETTVMQRDLAIVANKPSSANVGFAQVSIGIMP